MTLLLAEITTIETAIKENNPITIKADTPTKDRGGKERIDMIAQMTRTLEKLIDLKRAEMADEASREGDPAETERLSRELVKRLKVLDRKRREIESRTVDVETASSSENTSTGSGRDLETDAFRWGAMPE
ncbi:hypothetical protein [Fulvimarina sp. MAC8]|uniref:hypothetical protein n=1 Tax=Fulvimarina sp. MAC8 TaxID=3162874 RepID=UPI0032EE10E0